jgi:hypothetical protein
LVFSIQHNMRLEAMKKRGPVPDLIEDSIKYRTFPI